MWCALAAADKQQTAQQKFGSGIRQVLETGEVEGRTVASDEGAHLHEGYKASKGAHLNEGYKASKGNWAHLIEGYKALAGEMGEDDAQRSFGRRSDREDLRGQRSFGGVCPP